MGEKQKICIECGHIEDSDYCKHCGNTMINLIILATNNMVNLKEAEIFVKNETNLTKGIHVGCTGSVDAHKTTKGNKAYSCRRCYLRIEE